MKESTWSKHTSKKRTTKKHYYSVTTRPQVNSKSAKPKSYTSLTNKPKPKPFSNKSNPKKAPLKNSTSKSTCSTNSSALKSKRTRVKPYKPDSNWMFWVMPWKNSTREVTNTEEGRLRGSLKNWGKKTIRQWGAVRVRSEAMELTGKSTRMASILPCFSVDDCVFA